MKGRRAKLVYTCDTRPLRDIPHSWKAPRYWFMKFGRSFKETGETALRRDDPSGADAEWLMLGSG